MSILQMRKIRLREWNNLSESHSWEVVEWRLELGSLILKPINVATVLNYLAHYLRGPGVMRQTASFLTHTQQVPLQPKLYLYAECLRGNVTFPFSACQLCVLGQVSLLLWASVVPYISYRVLMRIKRERNCLCVYLNCITLSLVLLEV